MFRKGSNASLMNNLPVQSVDVEWHSLSREMQFVPPSPAKEGVTESVTVSGQNVHVLTRCSFTRSVIPSTGSMIRLRLKLAVPGSSTENDCV